MDCEDNSTLKRRDGPGHRVRVREDTRMNFIIEAGLDETYGDNVSSWLEKRQKLVAAESLSGAE